MFNKYLQSSFPYTLFTSDDLERMEYLRGIYSTIVLTDIVTRLEVHDVPVLERVIRTLFSDIGSPISIKKLPILYKVIITRQITKRLIVT
ncbi:Putative uncharacterized protein [Lactobacillus helveticus CIRM-BIA 101]|nr:hypothetical protein HMPREF0518_0446 [Lactobacillus helveticus DSM 20075 = CGMCC 1.1877]GFP15093.1 hypothetical protein LHEJCM1120_07220 [Lactobacillus helveticus]CDI60217.1 Putative uncharacterized protein [Lactobacillus helveticus CIRM-BIA 104]CDI65489.1 Putative uncharacterized protein [Lactobacillus helveticus CIRM-BIA 101]